MDSGAGWCEELLTELKWNKKKRIKAPFSSWTQGKDNKKCWMDIVLKELQACGRHGWQEAYWCLALLAAPAASKPTLKIFFWSESFKTDNFFDASRVLQLESSLQKETLPQSIFNDATAGLIMPYNDRPCTFWGWPCSMLPLRPASHLLRAASHTYWNWPHTHSGQPHSRPLKPALHPLMPALEVRQPPALFMLWFMYEFLFPKNVCAILFGTTSAVPMRS